MHGGISWWRASSCSAGSPPASSGRSFSLTLSPGSCGPKLEHPLKAVLFFNGMLVAVIVASGVTQFLREQLPGPGLVVTPGSVGFYFAMLLVVLDKLPHRARRG